MTLCQKNTKRTLPPLPSAGAEGVVIRRPSKTHAAIMGSSAADRERFWANVSKRPHPKGCWECQKTTTYGYGRTYIDRISIQAHRFSYFIHHGTLYENLMVCHGCNNKPCVNPDHLFLGTMADNVTDAVHQGRHAEANKTHCPNGHEYTPENTYSKADGTSRRCKICTRAWAREWHRKNKERVNTTRRDKYVHSL